MTTPTRARTRLVTSGRARDTLSPSGSSTSTCFLRSGPARRRHRPHLRHDDACACSVSSRRPSRLVRDKRVYTSVVVNSSEHRPQRIRPDRRVRSALEAEYDTEHDGVYFVKRRGVSKTYNSAVHGTRPCRLTRVRWYFNRKNSGFQSTSLNKWLRVFAGRGLINHQ